jgi:hypothetical protein
MLVTTDGIDLRRLRPTGEVLVFWTLFAVSQRVSWGRALRLVMAVIIFVLVVVRVDRAIFHLVSRTEPLFYDQLFLFRHGAVLVTDLTGAPILVTVGILVLLSLLGTLGVRRLVRGAAPLFVAPLPEDTRRVGIALWGMVALSAAIGVVRGGPTRGIRWMIPEVLQNIATSRRVYAAAMAGVRDSPYGRYDALRLERKPDVYLFFVESYGRLATVEPHMRPSWAEAITESQRRLSDAGFHMASGFSTAPVSGGRSWLAVSSILCGIDIRYEPTFSHIVHGAVKPPNLVQFFGGQGYRTVYLAPSVRPRPGIPAENPFGHDTLIGFPELGYTGRKAGWGLVPDQYSLGFTEEHVLRDSRHPLFFHFHMVSSHAMWTDLPSYVDDWHTLNDGRRVPDDDLHASRFNLFGSYRGRLTDAMRGGYVQSLVYDFRVLTDFLTRLRGDALVIMMGDHQPPVVSPEDADFDSPVHVLARDPKLLAAFREAGFIDGLALRGNEPASVRHAGLFSLIVRALVGASGHETDAVPFLRDGVGP